MDYEQLYTYLESRPLKEQKDCMQRIVQLVRRQCSDGEIDQLLHLRDEGSRDANETSMVQHRSQIKEQFWTQQAVWNKFGDPDIEHTSFNTLTLATAPLFMKTAVAQYLVANNKLIDELAGTKKDKNRPKEDNTTISISRLAPPTLTVPKAQSTTQHSSHPHSKSGTETVNPKACVEQVGDVSRPLKRGRESASNRFDDEDLRVLPARMQSAPHNQPSTTPADYNITAQLTASQDGAFHDKDNGAAEGKDGESLKKPRRAGFFD